jgi:monothiol glutaredoxin
MTSKHDEIKSIIKDNKVVLFMKGTKDFPQCGFSAKVAKILELCGSEFVCINILDDHEMRENIKIFSDWPTIPQLYINGEFIGGCDITTEMYQSGDLQKLLSA